MDENTVIDEVPGGRAEGPTGKWQLEATRAVAWPDPKKPWFALLEDDHQEGPFPLSTLRAHIRSGRVQPDTYVWQQGMKDWALAGDLPQLTLLWEDLHALSEAAPEPPPVARKPGPPVLEPFVPPAPELMDLGTYLFSDLSNPSLVAGKEPTTSSRQSPPPPVEAITQPRVQRDRDESTVVIKGNPFAEEPSTVRSAPRGLRGPISAWVWGVLGALLLLGMLALLRLR